MDFITCHHRKSWPSVSTAVCESCKRMGICADYQNYINPSLFPNLSEPGRKKIRRQKIKGEDPASDGPEQLTLDLEPVHK